MSEPSQRPPIATAPLSVILHARALSTQTAEAIDGWRRYPDARARAYEIILIQETRPEAPPSPDEPAPPALRVIPYERAAGYRDALNAAIAASTQPLLVFCPCDKQYEPADLESLLREIDQVDLAVGYRKGGQAPPWRVMLDLYVGLF